MRTDDIEMLPTENLSADPVISKVRGQRAGAERGPLTVDPATDLEHRPRPEQYMPLDAAEAGARNASQGNPGRYSDAELWEKPSKHESPYRSRCFVSPRSSADGNAYGVGEPIPEVEARRQAELIYGEVFRPIVETVDVVTLVDDEAVVEGDVVAMGESVVTHEPEVLTTLPPTTGELITTAPHGSRTICSKCEGHGKSPKMVAKHGPEIGHCPGCRVCNVCGGSGYLDDTEEVAP